MLLRRWSKASVVLPQPFRMLWEHLAPVSGVFFPCGHEVVFQQNLHFGPVLPGLGALRNKEEHVKCLQTCQEHSSECTSFCASHWLLLHKGDISSGQAEAARDPQFPPQIPSPLGISSPQGHSSPRGVGGPWLRLRHSSMSDVPP